MLELVQKNSKICVSEDTSEARGPKAGSSESNNPSEAGVHKLSELHKMVV